MDYLDNPKKKPKLQGRPVLRRIDADFDRRSQVLPPVKIRHYLPHIEA